MPGERLSAGLWKALFQVCFFVLFFQLLALAEWIVVSTLTWQSPIARLVPMLVVLVAAEAVSLIFYFRRPWIAVIVSWLGAVLIAVRGIPWGKPGWGAAVRRFDFQIIALVVAHLALVAFVMKNRAEAAEEEELDAATSVPAPAAEGETIETR